MAEISEVAPGLRFVLTGTGHSGTGFFASVMNRLGFPCGHEGIFTYGVKSRGDLVGDSSALAAPKLGQLREVNPDICIFHQVRHPALFVRSMQVRRGLFREGQGYGDYMLKHAPEAAKYQEGRDPTAEWAAMFWMEWNDMIRPYANTRWQIEGMGVGPIMLALAHLNSDVSPDRVVEVLKMDDLNWNRHVPEDSDPLPEGVLESMPFYGRLVDTAERYGYWL